MDQPSAIKLQHCPDTAGELLVDYRALLAKSPDTVMLLDIDSERVFDANASACALFGLSGQELQGRTLPALCPERQPDGTPSSELLASIISSVLRGAVRVFEATLVHSSGRLIPCEIRLVRMPTSARRLMQVRIADISRRQLDDKLRLGQARVLEKVARGAPLRDTLDSLMLLIEDQSDRVYCSVMLLDEDGVTMHCGSGPSMPPAYMAALEGVHIGPGVGSCGTAMYRKDKVIVTDIMNDPLWAPYRELIAPFGFRACWSTPIFLEREQMLGTFAMYYNEVRSPNEDDMRLIDVATHLAGIAIERTRRERELAQHRDRLEELVAARTAELTTALDTLSLTQEELVRRDKLAALGALVAGVAHELNTPIGNSLVIATTMADQARSLAEDMASGLRRSRLEGYLARTEDATTILARNLQRAATLVASFKQLAVDSTSSQRRTFSAAELLHEIARPWRIAARPRPVSIELDIEGELAMDSFPGPLSQVLGSLFDNCMVHAFDGDRPGLIRIRAHPRDADTLAIAIEDNGAGIAPELLERVYDPFFTTKLGSGGSGLGLHVAHNIVTGILGGKIELESAPGAGSTFTLVLPATAPAGPGAR